MLGGGDGGGAGVSVHVCLYGNELASSKSDDSGGTLLRNYTNEICNASMQSSLLSGDVN